MNNRMPATARSLKSSTHGIIWRKQTIADCNGLIWVQVILYSNDNILFQFPSTSFSENKPPIAESDCWNRFNGCQLIVFNEGSNFLDQIT